MQDFSLAVWLTYLIHWWSFICTVLGTDSMASDFGGLGVDLIKNHEAYAASPKQAYNTWFLFTVGSRNEISRSTLRKLVDPVSCDRGHPGYRPLPVHPHLFAHATWSKQPENHPTWGPVPRRQMPRWYSQRMTSVKAPCSKTIKAHNRVAEETATVILKLAMPWDIIKWDVATNRATAISHLASTDSPENTLQHTSRIQGKH